MKDKIESRADRVEGRRIAAMGEGGRESVESERVETRSVTLRVPSDLLAELDKAGGNRSALIVEAVRQWARRQRTAPVPKPRIGAPVIRG